MRYIDCHTHAQFAAYGEDREEVIKRALDENVGMVNVGTQKDTSKAAVDLAHQYDNTWASVGLHPIHTDKSFHDIKELGGDESAKGFTSRGEKFDYEYYKELAKDSKVVAIGECGLDYFRIENNNLEIKSKQKEAFVKQIELALDVKKPLMIHCRDAFDDLIEILDSYFLSDDSEIFGITHFFTGSRNHAERLLKMGFYFTFGGVITFARDYDEVIKMVPTDRILSETDAPYVTPAPHRGKRNEPAYVKYVVKKLAEIKGMSETEMEEQLMKNAKKALGI